MSSMFLDKFRILLVDSYKDYKDGTMIELLLYCPIWSWKYDSTHIPTIPWLFYFFLNLLIPFGVQLDYHSYHKIYISQYLEWGKFEFIGRSSGSRYPRQYFSITKMSSKKSIFLLLDWQGVKVLLSKDVTVKELTSAVVLSSTIEVSLLLLLLPD